MKERFKTLSPYLLFALAVLFIIFSVKDCKGSLGKPKTEYVYVTDTVLKNENYRLKKLLKQKTPPKEVTKWLSPEIIFDTLYLNKGIIYIPVPSQDTLKINPQFIANYTDASKLIEFNLNKGELEITTFDKDAKLYTNKYPLYLDKYKYQWYDNDLHHIESPYKDAKTKMKWNNLYLNGGYSVTQGSGLLGLEYNLSPGRFKVDIDADVTIEENPNFLLKAKLGYRLFE